jgi:hypothetical protein
MTDAYLLFGAIRQAGSGFPLLASGWCATRLCLNFLRFSGLACED